MIEPPPFNPQNVMRTPSPHHLITPSPHHLITPSPHTPARPSPWELYRVPSTKPIIFAVLFLIFSQLIAQPVIYKCKDDYGGFNFHFVSEQLNCIGPNNTGFSIDPFVNSKGEFKYLIVQSWAMGRCCNAAQLMFVFANNRKMSLVGDNAVSCMGFAFFGLNRNQIKFLSQYPLLSVEFQNGLAGTAHKHIVDSAHTNYFINFFSAISSKKLVVIKPSDL